MGRVLQAVRSWRGGGDLCWTGRGMQCPPLPSAVRSLTVCHPYHQDDKLVVQKFVNHSIVAYAQASQAAESAFEGAALEGLLTEAIDGFRQAGPRLAGGWLPVRERRSA